MQFTDMLLVADYCILDKVDYKRVEGSSSIRDLYEYTRNRDMVVAIDQSTIHTGMAIADADDDSLIAVLDLMNWGFTTKQNYYTALRNFLKNNLSDTKIKYFVYEAPLEHAPNFYTRRILQELRDYIKILPKHINSLSTENMYEINNLVWKKHFLKSDEYRGLRSATEDVKLSAMVESIKRFPYLKSYIGHYTTPPDCCDAIGILYGFLKETRSSFSKNIRRPNKTMPNRGPLYDVSFVGCQLKKVKDYCSANIHGEYEILEYNPELTVEENCQRFLSVSSKVGVLIVTSKKALQILKWETNITLKSSETILVICEHK